MIKFLPKLIINTILKHASPRVVSKFSVENCPGVFVACPLTIKQMKSLPKEQVLDKIVQSCIIAKEHGADIVSLGAFTAIVTEQGMAIKDRVPVALTSGRAFTVWSIMEQIKPYLLTNTSIAIVGAHGTIGDAIARLSAQYPIIAVGRENIDEMYDADIIVLCTSHPKSLVDPYRLKPGTVVCDAARPVNIPRNHNREDIVIIEGAQIDLPHNVVFDINFDCEPNRVYACMAEPMILAISGRIENFCLGNKIQLEKIEEIGNLSKQYGFKVVRSFEHPNRIPLYLS